MSSKLSPSQRRQLARARARLVSVFFPNGLPPEDAVVQLFKYWEVRERLYPDQMRARLKRLAQTHVIEIDPPLPRGRNIRGGGPAIKARYRILRWSPRLFGPAPAGWGKAVPRVIDQAAGCAERKSRAGAKGSRILAEAREAPEAEFPHEPYPPSDVSFNRRQELAERPEDRIRRKHDPDGFRRHFPEWPRNFRRSE